LPGLTTILCIPKANLAGGKTVKNGQVDVSDLKGNLLLTGNTDEKGEFSFKVPQKTALKIELKSGMGHQAEWIIGEKKMENWKKAT
jgi:nickel transport protein